MNHETNPSCEHLPQPPGELSSERALLRRLAQGAVIFGSRDIFLVGADFLSALLLIRLLPADDYGRLALVLSARSIAAVVPGLGLETFIVTEVARSHGQHRPDQVKRFLLRYSQLTLWAGVGFLALAGIAQWPVRRMFSPLVAWLVLIIGIDLLITSWRRVIRVTFYGYASFTYTGAIDVLESVLKLGLLVLLLVLFDTGLWGATAVYPLSTAIALLLVLPAWLKIVWPLRLVAASREPVFREGLRGPGKWAIALRPLKQVRDELPIWLVRGLAGNIGVALFAVAKKGYNYTALLLGALEDVLLPLISESVDANRQTFYRLVHSAGKYALVGASLLVGIGVALSPLIYDMVFEYPAAASTYRLLLLTLPVRALALYQRPMLFALRGQKYLVLTTALSLLWLVVAVGLGLVWFGVAGAAGGVFVNVLMVIIVRHWAIRRLRPEFRLVWKEFLRIDEFDRRLFERLRSKLLRLP